MFDYYSSKSKSAWLLEKGFFCSLVGVTADFCPDENEGITLRKRKIPVCEATNYQT